MVFSATSCSRSGQGTSASPVASELPYSVSGPSTDGSGSGRGEGGGGELCQENRLLNDGLCFLSGLLFGSGSLWTLEHETVLVFALRGLELYLLRVF